jgi:hypothetical protein
MFASLVATAGLWFVIACAFQILAVFVEQAGAARSPEEDKPHAGFGAFAVGVAALLAPGLLLMHGYFVTEGAADPSLRMLALGAPLAVVILGALLGAIFGAIAPGTASVTRAAAPWFAVVGLVLAAYAAMASIAALIAAIQNGGVLVLPVTP